LTPRGGHVACRHLYHPFHASRTRWFQISSLLEALPGIASVLRSPVADALIKAMRGAAGLADFAFEDAEELVRYAVRRD